MMPLYKRGTETIRRPVYVRLATADFAGMNSTPVPQCTIHASKVSCCHFHVSQCTDCTTECHD